MWKNRKLREKLGVGFGGVLVLTITVALFGWGGLRQIQERVDKTEEVSALVAGIQQARQAEKNYIHRREAEYATQLNETIAELLRRAKALKLKFEDRLNDEQMDNVMENMLAYQAAFAKYVDYVEQAEDAVTGMNRTAETALRQVEKIRQDQKNELVEIRRQALLFRDDKLRKAEQANQLLRWALDAKALRIALMDENPDPEQLRQWDALNQQILELTREMKAGFKLEKNLRQADAILERYSGYQQLFRDYLNTREDMARRQAEHITLVAEAGAESMRQMEAISQDQQAQLAARLEENERRMDVKLAKAREAVRVVKRYLEVRQNEKNFTLSGEPADFNQTLALLQETMKLAGELRQKFEKEQNHERGELLVNALKEYRRALERYTGAGQEQKPELRREMERIGQQVLALAEAVRADQADQVTELRQQALVFRDDKLSKANEAQQLLKWALEAKALRIQLMHENTPATLNAWKELNRKILASTRQLRSRFTLEKNLVQADAILSTYQRYQELFLEYLENKREFQSELAEKITGVAAAGADSMREMQAINADQKAQLDQRLKENETLIDDRLDKLGQADQIATWYLDARHTEKQYIISGNPEKVDGVLEITQRIRQQAEDLAARLEKRENIQVARQVINALDNYRKAFERYLLMHDQEIEAEQEMVRAARAALTVNQQAKADQETKMRQEAGLTRVMVGGLALAAVALGLLVAYLTTRNIVKPLNRAVELSSQLSQGNLSARARTGGNNDETGQLLEAMNAMASALQAVISETRGALAQLAEGEKQIEIRGEFIGDFVEIKNALQVTAMRLAEATERNETQSWLKTGQAQLNESLGGDQSLQDMAENVINFLVPYLDAQVGAFFLVDEGQNEKGEHETRLNMVASHAYTWRKNLANRYRIGEGLVGQAALERKAIVVERVPEDYIHVESGLGESTPAAVLVMPFLFEGELKGIIELASLQGFSRLHLDFLEQVMPGVAIAINTAESRTRMKELLAQTQAQSEELQQQQASLQQSNEELQSQSEELQSQQEELRQINEELEERTNALERQQREVEEKNRELEKARAGVQAKAEELELASKYKSEFLANMSHELRTPLNSLLILAQMLADNKEGTLSERQQEYAHTIYNSGSDLLTLINDILDLSKVEAGRIEIHAEDTSLENLATSLEQKFKPVANQRGLEFNINLAGNLPAVIHADDQRLKQVLTNLLGNAFKFTQQGSVTLDVARPDPGISLERSGLKPATTLAFSVRDTGIGIPVDKQKVIFEAFQQADGTTSRRYGGTGLGLSISRQLVQLMGGEIQITSEEGKGSCFTVYLPEHMESKTAGDDEHAPPAAREPVAAPPVPAVKSTPAGAPGDDRETLQTGDKSILIVEDDRNFSNILLDLAREKGFKCLLAEDGRTGLQLAEQYKPSAVILDLGLPLVDGWTVMEKLKDNPETRHIPVHFVSASDYSIDARRMGAIGYSLKPVSMAELGEAFRHIEEFLGRSGKKLLLASDNQARREAMQELISGSDARVSVAVGREDVLRQMRGTRFDCLVLDVDMEQQTGIHLLEQLRDKQDLEQVPVILYAERGLNETEQGVVQQCTANLTIKEVHSGERLLDEVTLFLHQVETKLSQDQQTMLRRVRNKEGILEGKRVLLVDDDARNVFALTAALEEKGMEVMTATNGREALQALEAQPDTDVVLMDIMMPEMDGYEATRKIREKGRFHKLPIIALTAKAMKGDKAKCIEAGANDYLSKPIEPSRLISLLRVWLY